MKLEKSINLEEINGNEILEFLNKEISDDNEDLCDISPCGPLEFESLKKQFQVKNDVDNKRFVFTSNDNNSCSYTVVYFECDSDENNAWICVYKANKAEMERKTSNVI